MEVVRVDKGNTLAGEAVTINDALPKAAADVFVADCVLCLDYKIGAYKVSPALEAGNLDFGFKRNAQTCNHQSQFFLKLGFIRVRLRVLVVGRLRVINVFGSLYLTSLSPSGIPKSGSGCYSANNFAAINVAQRSNSFSWAWVDLERLDNRGVPMLNVIGEVCPAKG